MRNLVNDGSDSGWHNNHGNTWTYNQGVVLDGLSALGKETGAANLVGCAKSIAMAAISRLNDQGGILDDSCEPKCGTGGVQFKGIFARNPAVLNSAAPKLRFRVFLKTNAESMWRNQGANHRFGVLWPAPSEPQKRRALIFRSRCPSSCGGIALTCQTRALAQIGSMGVKRWSLSKRQAGRPVASV
jgi:hypothetical protein